MKNILILVAIFIFTICISFTYTWYLHTKLVQEKVFTAYEIFSSFDIQFDEEVDFTVEDVKKVIIESNRVFLPPIIRDKMNVYVLSLYDVSRFKQVGNEQLLQSAIQISSGLQNDLYDMFYKFQGSPISVMRYTF